MLPELRLIDILDVFVPGAIKGKVRATKTEPIVGELIRDATGRWFLAPEEDYRGAGMHSIRLHDLPPHSKRHYVNKVVKVAGVFEDNYGLTVEAIVLAKKSFPE